MASSDGHPPPTSVVLRPLGSALGLSLGGLAMASLVMAGYDLGWVPVGDAGQVGLVLLVTVVPLQVLGAIFALLSRDGAAGGSLALQAATWAAVGVSHMTSVPGSTSPTLGLAELAGGALIALGGLTAARSKLVPGGAIALSGVHFVFGGVYEMSVTPTWQNVSGVIGLVVVALAGYGAWAAELEDVAGCPVVPLGRNGRVAVAQEPGVRRQL